MRHVAMPSRRFVARGLRRFRLLPIAFQSVLCPSDERQQFLFRQLLRSLLSETLFSDRTIVVEDNVDAAVWFIGIRL